MSIADAVEYITLGNPISRTLINSSGAIMRGMGLRPKELKNASQSLVALPVQKTVPSLHSLIGNNYNFVRIAGLGGASAIFMGAYCKYQLRDIRDPKEQQEAQTFVDVANRIHFLHSFALMCMPMAHYPIVTGGIMLVGTIFFSGSMYYRALSGDKRSKNYATVGGFCLMFGWLTLIF